MTLILETKRKRCPHDRYQVVQPVLRMPKVRIWEKWGLAEASAEAESVSSLWLPEMGRAQESGGRMTLWEWLKEKLGLGEPVSPPTPAAMERVLDWYAEKEAREENAWHEENAQG